MPLEAPVTSALRPRRFKSMETLPLAGDLGGGRELRDRALEPFADVGCEGRAHENPKPRCRIDLSQNNRHPRKSRLGAAAWAEGARAQVEARALRQDRARLGARELEHDTSRGHIDQGMMQSPEHVPH